MTSDLFDDDDYTGTTENKSYIGSGTDRGKNQMYQFQTGSMTLAGNPAYLATYDNYASPYHAAFNKSFRRDEIYRMGLVFIDKYGRESYTKWVSDVRMPRTFDTSGTGGTSQTFELFYNDGTNIKIQGITALVNMEFPSQLLDADIIGYRTVYVKRTSSNSTILDNGIVGSLEAADPTLDSDYNINGFVFPTSIVNATFDGSSHADYFNATEIPANDLGIPSVSTINDTTVNRIEDRIKEYISPDLNYGPTVLPTHGALLVGYSELEQHTSTYSYNTSAVYGDNTIYFKKYNTIKTEGGNAYCTFDVTDFSIFSDLAYSGGNKDTCFNKSVGGYKVYNYSKGAGSDNDNDQARGTCGIIAGTIGDSSAALNYFEYGTGNDSEAMYIARKQVIEPYGGLSFEDRLQNTYEECSPFIYFNGLPAQVSCTGDTFIGMMEHVRTMLTASGTDELDSNNMEVIYFPCESSYNIILRSDSPIYRLHDRLADDNSLIGVHETPGVYELDDTGTLANTYEQDWYMYDNNDTYGRNDFLKSYLPAPLGYVVGETYRHDTKIIGSELKSNRELIDSWTKFLFANEIELKTNYGPITDLALISDNMIALQEKAIANISINEREQIVGDSGVTLSLGTGTLLERFDYISTTTGCQSKYGHIVTPTGLYYYDGNNKGIYALTQKGEPSLTKVTFMDSYFKNQPYADFDIIDVGYNRKYNDVLFTFKIAAGGTAVAQETLVFNDVRGYFTHFLDTYRGKHVYDDRILFSLQVSGTDLIFYQNNIEDALTIDGETFDCDLTIISIPENSDIARFDFLEWNSVVKTIGTKAEESDVTFDSIICNNTYQSTVSMLASLFRRRFRLWRLNQLRHSATTRGNLQARLRSEWLKSKFSFTPDDNQILIDSIKVYYGVDQK